MKYRIDGSLMQTLYTELENQESVYAESGGMAWMSDNIELETSTKGGILKGLSRKLAGESMFMTTFTARGGPGKITFASEFPGKILALDVSPKQQYVCQKDAFMCAQPSVKVEMHFHKKIMSGLFGGEGFIMQKLTGTGKTFVELTGEITEKVLQPGETLKVDTGHIAMFEPTVTFDVKMMKGVKNILWGGEGLFLAELTGPGKIWLQSMPLANLAGKIGKYLSTGTHAGGSDAGILGKISDFGSGI